MIQIANPIYDSVFKYMMQNKKVCKTLLGALLNAEIEDVEIRNNEIVKSVLKKFTVLRLDFIAKVKKEDGTSEMVSIELQKAQKDTEIVRFRRYLSRLYDKEAYDVKYVTKTNRKGKKIRVKQEIPIHINAIYILGHPLKGIKEPVIYYTPQATNALNEPIENVDTNDFFMALSHNSIVVQIPYLRDNAKTHVEKILNIFNQKKVLSNNKHIIQLNDETDSKQEGYNEIIYELMKAITNEDVKRAMDIEDEYAADIEDRIELEDILEEQKKQLSEQKEQLSQKDEQLSKQNAIIVTLIKSMLSEGKTVDDISTTLNIPKEVVTKMIK